MSDMPDDPAPTTRSAIIAAFAQELSREGFRGVSLDTVAKQTGIRKASLYHHFPAGKESIFLAVAMDYIERQRAHVAAALDSDRGLEDQLVRLAALQAEAPDTTPDLDQQVYDATRHVSDDIRREVSKAYVDGLIGPVVATMAKAIDAGELTGEAASLAWTFLGMASSLAPLPDDVAMLPQDRGPRQGAREAATALVSLFLNGARPR